MPPGMQHASTSQLLAMLKIRQARHSTPQAVPQEPSRFQPAYVHEASESPAGQCFQQACWRGVPVSSNCVKVEIPDWIAALRPA